MSVYDTLRHWSKGIRLYLGIGIGLVSLLAWWWAELAFAGDPDLIAARLHEVFGWLSLIMLAVTLAVGPLYKIAPGMPGKFVMRDARRLMGIAAAWFATLHVLIAYLVSLDAVNLLGLSGEYAFASVIGLVSLVILLAMAFTSFDAAMRRMKVWWFRLHRLVYVAVALALWHAFMIGVHAAQLAVLATVVGVAMVLYIGHVHLALQAGKVSRWQVLGLGVGFVVLAVLSNYGIQQYIELNSVASH